MIFFAASQLVKGDQRAAVAVIHSVAQSFLAVERDLEVPAPVGILHLVDRGIIRIRIGQTRIEASDRLAAVALNIHDERR